MLCGIKLQSAEEVGGALVWTDLNPTDSYIYNRGAGSVKQGSASGSILVNPTAEPKIYYRLMLWKEGAISGSTNAITLINSCQIIIKQIN